MADGNTILPYDPTGAIAALNLPGLRRPLIAPTAGPQQSMTPQQMMTQMLANGTPASTALAAQSAQNSAGQLQSIQAQGSQHSSSWAALMANLLADGVAEHTAKSAQAKLIQSMVNDATAARAGQLKTVGLGPDGSPLTSTPPAAAPAANTPAALSSPTPTQTDRLKATFATHTQPRQDRFLANHSYRPAGLQPFGGPLQIGSGTYDGDPPPHAPGSPDSSNVATGSSNPADPQVSGAPLSSPGGLLAAAGGPLSFGADDPLVSALMSIRSPSSAGQQAPTINAAAQGPPAQVGFPGAAAQGSDPARVGPQITPQDRDALIRLTYGEARGEPLHGQQATAAVALNRSILSGLPVAKIATMPGQFEGMKVGAQLDPRSPEYQRIAQVIDPLLSGKMPDPSGGATGFYSPGAQAALGRSKPAWDDGSGRQIGNQLFFNHPFAGRTMATDPVPGGAQAYQVAANGPTPPPPSSAMGTPQGEPQPAPGVQYGPGPTPQETAIIQQLMRTPGAEAQQQWQSMVQGIRQRMTAPIETELKYDAPTGQSVYVPKVAGYGREVAVAPPPGWRPPLAAGQQYGPNGVAGPIPGTQTRPLSLQERAAWGISPDDRRSYGVGPDGKPTVVAEGTYSAPVPTGPGGISQMGPTGKVETQSLPGTWTPAQVLEARTNLSGSKPVLDAREAMANFNALKQLALQPGGTKAYGFRDALARIFNPGGIARTNQIELLTNSAGVPDAVKQYFGNLRGDGNLDPRIAQQGLDAAYAFAKSRADQVSGLNRSNAELARRHGLDPADLQVEMDPLGDAVSLPGQRSAYAPAPTGHDVAASLAAARAAIQQGKSRAAVIQRLQAAGINPGQL